MTRVSHGTVSEYKGAAVLARHDRQYLLGQCGSETYTAESLPAGRRRVCLLAAFAELMCFRLVDLIVRLFLWPLTTPILNLEEQAK
jgi:hypothetical protein